MGILKTSIKSMRVLYRNSIGHKQEPFPFEGYIQLRDQDANDYIARRLSDDAPFLVGKFGTVELTCLLNHQMIHGKKNPMDAIGYIRGTKRFLWWWDILGPAHLQAGIFPPRPEVMERFCEIMFDTVGALDVLGSYVVSESKIRQIPSDCMRVNLDGFYAPFLFKNPWTSLLAGKKVLVVHPFQESIEHQYGKRERLFADPNVLPQFDLRTIKAVQSIRGEDPGFPDWIAAYEHMANQMDQVDYDIAILGCGAYGLPLAAHAKKRGKKAIHLAGWTQILFGIYGERWAVHPVVSKFINSDWVRPSSEETPKEAAKVEGGCYW